MSTPSNEALVTAIFDHLKRKYTQSADKRHRAMGLQYMMAETHDLAREMASLFEAINEGEP